MVRQPAVSGQFYTSTKVSLQKELSLLIPRTETKLNAIGIIMPHAGYIYSGAVAGAVIASVNITDTVLILGPNHTGRGKPLSIVEQGSWEMPLGQAQIDSDFSKILMKNSKLLSPDTIAHEDEHSIEVEIPFIQYLKETFKFVPICVGTDNLAYLKQLGLDIASAIKEFGKKVLIIASSDMTHYEPYEQAKKKDMYAIDAVLKLDAYELSRRVAEKNITMCGYAPAFVMLTAANILGAKEARLIKYQTSADTTGDYSSVVGYAGVVIS